MDPILLPLMITLITYVSDYFIIALVWIAAAVLALSRWRRHPRVSRLTLTAILIFFTESLVGVFTYLCSSSGFGTAAMKALASSSLQPESAKGVSMTVDRLYNLFFILFFFLFYISIPFWIPAAIELYLLTSRRNRLSYRAGFLTLKPIITTPIWAVIISLLHDSPVAAQLIAVWNILLGTGLTVPMLVIFWHPFFGSGAILAMRLIVLDCMRWINSGLFTVTITLPDNRATDTRTGILVLIGLIFPTVYSVIALPTTGPTCRSCSLTLTPSLRVIEIQLGRIASMTILSQLKPLVTARVTSTVSPIN